MKQSELFTKTRKQGPSDELSRNAELLIRGGFIHKEMAGVYSFLPLGLRVVNNISNIIRTEMNALGAQELKMTVLQKSEPWEKSGRWSDKILDVWFKTQLKSGNELGLGSTHEEPITDLLKEYISSYKDLPLAVYQIQAKFRNETRAKSGILRGREFLMKDMYSFSKNKEEHDIFYEKVKKAYENIFKKLNLAHITYLTFASGGTFSKYSHEFQTISPVGEDTIYIDRNKGIAINSEVLNEEVLKDLNLKRGDLVEEKAIEVGNIFTLATKFSNPLGLNYKNEKGENIDVFMGCYGMGPTRLMGTIVEISSDDSGIIWPESIAPFKVHLLSIGNDESVINQAEEVYKKLLKMGIETFFDDREVSPGEKFTDADLLGMPIRVVLSQRTGKDSVEIKKRTEKNGKIVSFDDFFKMAKKYV